VLGLLVPFALDGWRGLLWGGLVRLCLSHHITFCVNSVCHVFGRRPFDTGDRSTNQWLIGVLALGEGWHNNHHAFPQSAFHGLRWWQIDLSAYVIVLLEKLGLVSQVRRVSPEAQAARLARTA
jgi:stearoyl-CoA desaturase (delta-9 desaturase)